MSVVKTMFNIQFGNISGYDSDSIQINKTELPDYLLDDETSAYHIKEFMKGNISSLPKNATIDLSKIVNGRTFILNDDDLVNGSDKITVAITTSSSYGIPENISTGYSLVEVDEYHIFTKELFENIQREKQRLLDKITKIIEEYSNKMAEIIEIFSIRAKNCEGYEGESSNGLPHGYGIRKVHKSINTPDGTFVHVSKCEGNWNAGNLDGYGIHTVYNSENTDEISAEYKGFFVMGKRCGKGEYYDAGNGILSGTFSDDTIVGSATMVYENGDIYEGGWDMECRQGFGRTTHPDGTFFECEWCDDQPVSTENNSVVNAKKLDLIFKPFEDR